MQNPDSKITDFIENFKPTSREATVPFTTLKRLQEFLDGLEQGKLTPLEMEALQFMLSQIMLTLRTKCELLSGGEQVEVVDPMITGIKDAVRSILLTFFPEAGELEKEQININTNDDLSHQQSPEGDLLELDSGWEDQEVVKDSPLEVNDLKDTQTTPADQVLAQIGNLPGDLPEEIVHIPQELGKIDLTKIGCNISPKSVPPRKDMVGRFSTVTVHPNLSELNQILPLEGLSIDSFSVLNADESGLSPRLIGSNINLNINPKQGVEKVICIIKLRAQKKDRTGITYFSVKAEIPVLEEVKNPQQKILLKGHNNIPEHMLDKTIAEGDICSKGGGVFLLTSNKIIVNGENKSFSVDKEELMSLWQVSQGELGINLIKEWLNIEPLIIKNLTIAAIRFLAANSRKLPEDRTKNIKVSFNKYEPSSNELVVNFIPVDFHDKEDKESAIKVEIPFKINK